MSSNQLLIIDDDVGLTELLSEYLCAEGYAVDVANKPEEGLEIALSGKDIQVILLDVMMPNMNGFELLKQLRLHSVCPVIMLTAKGDDYDKILGLELGADDYLPKPFNHRELQARIHAIIRRHQFDALKAEPKNLQLNGLEVQPSSLQAFYHGTEVGLTGTEFAILRLLMEHAGELVSKDTISQKVLGRAMEAFDRSIDMHVSNVRKKLTAINEQEMIKTVRGAGYILVDTEQ